MSLLESGEVIGLAFLVDAGAPAVSCVEEDLKGVLQGFSKPAGVLAGMVVVDCALFLRSQLEAAFLEYGNRS